MSQQTDALREMLRNAGEGEAEDSVEEIVQFALSSALTRHDLLSTLAEEGVSTTPFSAFLDGFWGRAMRGADADGAVKYVRERGYLNFDALPKMPSSESMDAYAVGFYASFAVKSRLHPDAIAGEMPTRLVGAYRQRVKGMFGVDPMVQ